MNFFSTAFLALMAFCVVAEAVKFCYSGTDDKYREKECGLGVDNPLIMFWCQKYHCKDIDGGNIFTVRGCIYPGQDRCAAAQKQCAYQNGTLDCPTCETDLCNL